jgi:hypothetical protein
VSEKVQPFQIRDASTRARTAERILDEKRASMNLVPPNLVLSEPLTIHKFPNDAGPGNKPFSPLLAAIDALGSGEFTPVSVARADRRHPGVPLEEMLADARMFARELKETMSEIQKTMDPNDPQLAVVHGVLAILG